jgi:tRNA (cmo5U34)-methyltransferase
MSVNPMPVNLWTKTDHALEYLGRADSIAHRTEGESSLLEFIPQTTRRILDLGTGDGRLLALVKPEHPNTEAIAMDFSPAMLEAVRKQLCRRFLGCRDNPQPR